MFYADYFILGQIVEALNAPENVSSYVCKEREVKIVRLRYKTTTDELMNFVKPLASL